MKQTIKLKESDLKRMIAESVKRVINEADSQININTKTREIYAIAYDIMQAYDLSTAINVLENVKNDIQYYEDENGPYQRDYRNRINSWEHNHYGQIDTSDGKNWGLNY